MKPLILKFAENNGEADLDYSIIEYSKTQNLSVLTGTNIPAISQVALGTQTHTRVSSEGTDNDYDGHRGLNSLLETSTKSLSNSETTDSDFDLGNLRNLLDTNTLTKMSESSDSDR
ncbi:MULTISPECIES: hypothetical protein [unclassified Algoriphagus]|uniref:hypothetical protein n=1 Tax=unclassified Algoriphagus TaxID=2641541 RepID=UPI00098726BD|nr:MULTISPECIES: hypothetical protein [unclassified Algoriphagus]MBC6367579.1 hypothetical protein [Algoriphagus sp. AK58]OOG69497.1 hypothetical protein B0E43_21125 [Algoriphagus sp. A40]